jgi:superfamily II RNA helicase
LEFGKLFGEENVGLLTGDHKINTDALVVVGTTEILRNQLYDAMNCKSDLDYELVVLDEAHYLGDSQRGVVWEEVLIYMPERVKFLLLSATIGNAQQIADWLMYNRGRTVEVVHGGKRPVPLVPLGLKGKTLFALKDVKRGKFSSSKKAALSRTDEFPSIIKCFESLNELNLLPAIFFLKSRSDCNRAVTLAATISNEPEERKKNRLSVIEDHVENYPFLADYNSIKELKTKGVASHHAGHLPQYKMLVEELMSKNLLSAIFATSTVSAGVNFPARTVVIPNSDRFNGHYFSPLTATELAQMTGRAGRRGIDQIGFALLLPGQFMDLRLMENLFNAPPEPVKSRLFLSVSMVLNLLNAYELSDIPQLLSRSLAAWQYAKNHGPKSLKKASARMWNNFQNHLKLLDMFGMVDDSGHLTPDGVSTASLRLEHPLVLYMAIVEKGMPSDPMLLAAVIGSILNERPSKKIPYGQSSYARKLKHTSVPNSVKNAVATFHQAIFKTLHILTVNDFPAPGLPDLSTAKAIWHWAKNKDINIAARMLDCELGDAVRLILLVAENLNQLSNLKDRIELSESAREARKLILHPPAI